MYEKMRDTPRLLTRRPTDRTFSLCGKSAPESSKRGGRETEIGKCSLCMRRKKTEYPLKTKTIGGGGGGGGKRRKRREISWGEKEAITWGGKKKVSNAIAMRGGGRETGADQLKSHSRAHRPTFKEPKRRGD